MDPNSLGLKEYLSILMDCQKDNLYVNIQLFQATSKANASIPGMEI